MVNNLYNINTLFKKLDGNYIILNNSYAKPKDLNGEEMTRIVYVSNSKDLEYLFKCPYMYSIKVYCTEYGALRCTVYIKTTLLEFLISKGLKEKTAKSCILEKSPSINIEKILCVDNPCYSHKTHITDASPVIFTKVHIFSSNASMDIIVNKNNEDVITSLLRLSITTNPIYLQHADYGDVSISTILYDSDKYILQIDHCETIY